VRPEARAASGAVRKARLVRSFLEGAPVHCTWQLTPRCESFCHLCEHRAESAQEELDAASCARVAQELGRNGALLVSFTGSEPFLHGELAAIVSAVARHHFPLLVTNGWLVSAASARAVWQAGLEAASVTFAHADPAQHDAATGLGGSHARAVEALATLARERTRRAQRVNVRTRLRGADIGGLPELLALAARHDATVTLEAAFPLPELDGSGQGLAEELRRLKKRHPNLRSSGPLLDNLGRALRGGVPGCLAGRAFFNVDHRGVVTRCLEFRAPEDAAGSLADQRWPDVRRRLRASSAGNTCRACFYASRAEVETLYTVRGFLGGLRTLVSA
jgi:MoaA/NifB/PqqE/SkfB family radical SAM enzyme